MCQQYLQSPKYVSPQILDYFKSRIVETPLDSKKFGSPYIWVSYQSGFHAGYFSTWKDALAPLTLFKAASQSPVLYHSVEYFGICHPTNDNESPKTKPWLAIVHHLQELSYVHDWNNCRGLFFLHQWDHDQALQRYPEIKRYLSKRLDVLSHPYPRQSDTLKPNTSNLNSNLNSHHTPPNLPSNIKLPNMFTKPAVPPPPPSSNHSTLIPLSHHPHPPRLPPLID